ncbi:5-formyltetrahydrofolate cyclo-ligase [Alkaliphilus hydrothermalis]|uniref:5-formyltetrahydrofolate cyclo-ligase n=1 Tax=Alkaliphilus hydrothermalis TaxID=1482730 RepID=A0ABS2NMT9_9FIRM|nr:5-formyltetrahydrofolate cyclo-ligase [Alkaliphilus hydrothermalis]MBM7614248.1 5-formyltetrahydrofolate cyclo-ligase [Alkaliphilus hydrothermalis]
MKKIIRQKILNKRENLQREEVVIRSSRIIKNLDALEYFTNAVNIMLYLSFRNEVDTKDLIVKLLKENKRVFIPVTVPKTKELVVSELINPDADLELGHFGVMEPKQEALRPVTPETLDLVIVPGVAYDERGYRIGYGGGYYDRFLPKLMPNTPKVSIAFELQMIDQVDDDSFDIPVDFIITEERIISCKK